MISHMRSTPGLISTDPQVGNVKLVEQDIVQCIQHTCYRIAHTNTSLAGEALALNGTKNHEIVDSPEESMEVICCRVG